MTAVIEASALGKRYQWKWAVQDCDLELPQGKFVGLVGPNGAGKSTLLRMAAGLVRPSKGEIRVLGVDPMNQTGDCLARIGYLDQERPLIGTWRVASMLRFASLMNHRFDKERAERHVQDMGVSTESKIGSLSVGQRAQVAMAICLAKRADLLILDEPLDGLDPLARHQLMSTLMGDVAERTVSVVFSSHIVSELEPVCDHLVILSSSQVQVCDSTENLLSTHRVMIGPRHTGSPIAGVAEVIAADHTDRQSTLLVRTSDLGAIEGWQVVQPSLEEIVLAYLRQSKGE